MKPADSSQESARCIRKVFLVDDEPLVLKALTRVIKQEGYETRAFPGPHETLAALEGDRPDCIITDYYMPHMDGLNFLKIVKKNYPRIARVLITGGYIDDPVWSALREKTIHVLIQKPWQIGSIRLAMDFVGSGKEGVFLQGGEHVNLSLAQDEKRPADAELVPGADSAPCVLVVDDDESFLAITGEWLLLMGLRPLSVQSTQQAIDMAREAEPDIILASVGLVNSEGAELIGILRDLFPKVPIVAVTGKRELDAAQTAFRNGATVYLNKPLEKETFEATIHRCLQLGRLVLNGSSKRELSAAIEVQHAIASGMPVKSLLQLLLQELLRYTGADAASVLLVEPDGKTMRIAASYGLDEKIIKEERVAIGDRVSGWVVKHNEPQVIIGTPVDDPRLNRTSRQSAPSAGMCLPMRGRDRVLGAVCLTRYDKDEPFTRDAIDLGMLMAGEVARAMERAYEAELRIDLERDLMRQDKLATIGELVSGVAHEINNPLGYVNSNIVSLLDYIGELIPIFKQLLSARDTDGLEQVLGMMQATDLQTILPDLPVCLEETRVGVEKVIKIVSDLRTFAREDGQARELVDVNQILEGAVRILWNQIKYKSRLVREYGQLPSVSCYPAQLGQVFLNLIHNAVQAIGRDGVIILRTLMQDGHVVVEVEDNGEGMEKQVIDRIFDTFFTTKPRGQGTGLGLSIAKKIIDRHDGKINVTSQIGQGSVFRVTFPLPTES